VLSVLVVQEEHSVLKEESEMLLNVLNVLLAESVILKELLISHSQFLALMAKFVLRVQEQKNRLIVLKVIIVLQKLQIKLRESFYVNLAFIVLQEQGTQLRLEMCVHKLITVPKELELTHLNKIKLIMQTFHMMRQLDVQGVLV
jgi:hypothetical protein